MASLPTDGSHLSDVDLAGLIDEFGGLVEKQFAKSSIMRTWVPVRNVTGTDTIVNNRVGRTKLKALVPGVRPDADQTNFGKVQLTVDTVILARDNRSMLNELQTHFNARAELAEDQGKEMGKFFDQAFIIQAIKGSRQAAPTGFNGASLNGAIGAGKNVTLSALLDEQDPDKLYTAITSILTSMEEEDIDVSELVVLVRPKTYEVLKNNNKLMSRDYSQGNGDFAAHVIEEISGAPIVKTARIPNAAIPDHYLSNPSNGNAYNVSATEALVVAVILHPKSLFAGETIPVQSDIWFNKEEKQWFIDTFMAFGVTVNRPDVCGTVNKLG